MQPIKFSDVIMIPPSEIEVVTRLRNASAPGVASIVSSINEIGGILKPLLVRKIKGAYRLMDGLNRLEAALECELTEVPVRVARCNNDQAVRIEVDANVAGAPLSALDMAVFLAAHKALYDKENPQATQGKAGAAGRWNATDKMSVASFAANAAEVFGKCERQIYRLISVGEQLNDEHIKHLRSAPKRVQFKDLEAIAKCGDPADRTAICVALGAGESKSAKDVLDRKKQPGAAISDPVEDALKKLQDAWVRAPQATRGRFVRDRADELRALLPVEPSEATKNGEVVDFTSARSERHG